MIKFHKLSASVDFGLEFVNITFTIEDTNENLSDYQFDLERGNYDNDVFIPVHSNISDFECNDYSAILTNPEIRNYYKIKATHIPTDYTIESTVFTYPAVSADRYSSYLVNIYGKYLSVLGNKEMLLLKRRRTGRRCDCYDDVRGSLLSDKCYNCFGTGYFGGYTRPTKMKVNYMNAASKQEAIDIRGTFEDTAPIQLWTENYPLIQENDMVIDTLTGIRYTVANWQPSYKSGYLLRQTIQIIKLPESSKLYRIPV